MINVYLSKLKPVFILFIPFLLLSGCDNDNNNNNEQAFRLLPEFPSDIEGGAQNATFEEAARFAWSQFIALNWPALEGTRDVPDEDELFGDTSFDGPLV